MFSHITIRDASWNCGTSGQRPALWTGMRVPSNKPTPPPLPHTLTPPPPPTPPFVVVTVLFFLLIIWSFCILSSYIHTLYLTPHFFLSFLTNMTNIAISYFHAHVFPPFPSLSLCKKVTLPCTSCHLPLMNTQLDWVEMYGNSLTSASVFWSTS